MARESTQIWFNRGEDAAELASLPAAEAPQPVRYPLHLRIALLLGVAALAGSSMLLVLRGAG
jgi:hypothetical protein